MYQLLTSHGIISLICTDGFFSALQYQKLNEDLIQYAVTIAGQVYQHPHATLIESRSRTEKFCICKDH